MNNKNTITNNLLLSIFSILIVFLLLETAIRTYDSFNGKDFFSNHRNLIKKSIKPLRPFRTFGFDMYQNLNGSKHISSRHKELFSIKKPKNTYRIIVFGGSTTENLPTFKLNKLHYPLILQKQLQKAIPNKKIEVINVANSAYATPHSLIILELDAISWDPDLIIVSHNINDLLAAYWPNFMFDYSNKYNNKFYSLPDYAKIYSFSNVIFQYSQLYWIIQDRLNNFLSKSDSSIKRKSYGLQPPKEALKIFKRNLKSIVSIAKENNIRVLLGTQPLQVDENYFIKHMVNKAYNSKITYPLHEEFVNHHKEYNKVLIQIANKNGALHIDNNLMLAGDKKYFIDFVHYTPEGVKKLAENYTKLLIDKKIIQ